MSFKMIAVLLIIFCSHLWAQPEFLVRQSSPSINWKSKENQSVELIYPQELESESTYILNLINHYSHYVGQTYGITKPEKFSLILRSEMAEPNGFVTLAPRRSEWYTSSIFFPFVGATDWYQTLSIHEYRHLMQYDHFNQSTAKGLDYILGDFGRQVGMFLGLQPWYFEGDAVWAETKYSDAGRGRSPRFLARMKALVLSNKIPTYDEFLNGTYNNKLPNHYVYGYILITSATNKFGDSFWKNVTEDISRFPHPWRLVSSFRKISGVTFESFYNQTMGELRERWKEDLTEEKISEYQEETYPFFLNNELYSIGYNLDDYYAIYKQSNGSKVKITDIPFKNELDLISMANGKAVYPQLLPDKRYGYKEFSDIILVDLKTGTKQKITSQQRFYNPRLSKDANKMIALELTNEQAWQIIELDQSGKRLRIFKLKDYKFSNADYLDDNSIVAIALDKTSKRSIIKINLNTQESVELLSGSRNLIHNISTSPNQEIFFEAQYDGKNEIFMLTSSGSNIKKCTNSKIAAFTPSASGSHLYFSQAKVNGSEIVSRPLSECQDFEKKRLVDFNYLSQSSPSDHYTGFPRAELKDQESLYELDQGKYEKSTYHEFDKRGFIPHSWSIIGGRGINLGVTTDNYLGTFGFKGEYGIDAEENGSYLSIQADYKKYLPILSLNAEKRKREITYFESDDDLSWDEKTVGALALIPYFKRNDLYRLTASLGAGYGLMETQHYEVNGNGTGLRGQNFHVKSANLTLNYQKDAVARSIVSPYEFGYVSQIDQATNNSDKENSGFRFFHQGSFQIPGIFKHNALSIVGSQERQLENSGSYRFLPFTSSPLGYVFSRGYEYKSVSDYRKASANYIFPIAYPDLTLGSFYYLRRVHANLFYDHTTIIDQRSNPTLNSYGAELNFESKFFRILPLTIGLRALQKERDQEEAVEVFGGFSSLM